MKINNNPHMNGCVDTTSEKEYPRAHRNKKINDTHSRSLSDSCPSMVVRICSVCIILCTQCSHYVMMHTGAENVSLAHRRLSAHELSPIEENTAQSVSKTDSSKTNEQKKREKHEKSHTHLKSWNHNPHHVLLESPLLRGKV